jgi:4-amino-4-deoxy-L-arabinose transferase-like glycosyltransferase
MTAVTYLSALWARIHEPRAVSIIYFVMYTLGALAGLYSTANPPSSLEGQFGTMAMAALTALLTFGCTLGAVAALPGIYWLERSAVLSVALAALIYLSIVLVLHTQNDGNRLLQGWFVLFVLGMQGVRWVRVSARPYRPDEPTVAEV